MTEPIEYRYGGARAMVTLHERQLRKFLVAWEGAQRAGVQLPESDNPNYASLETLLHHVLRCARSYMTWMCEKLELPDPGIRPEPELAVVAAEAADYVEHLVERWRPPLVGVTEEQAESPTFTSRWGVDYCIDAMLEHAVMHPLRHRFQLEELTARARASSA
jgi:uncharacterized damage-inducible protein DinB